MEKDWGKHFKQKERKRERQIGNLGLIMGQQQAWCNWNVLGAAKRETSVGIA